MIIKESQDEIWQYLIDQASYKGKCEKVFLVESTADIEFVLSRANELKVPVTVSGNHTSLTGSAIPESGWVISTERLNRILEINQTEKYAILEPGVMLKDLQLALKEFNLFFPPDPTEDTCFIGGMVSTNASGARSFKYGSTRNYIQGMELILADGRVINLSRKEKINGNEFVLKPLKGGQITFEIPSEYKLSAVKNTVGYHLHNDMEVIDTFIGSEGTLAIISRIKIGLRKIPQGILSLVVFFEDIDTCFSFIKFVRAESKSNSESFGINARAIEFFDKRALQLLKSDFPDIPGHASCAVWIEQEMDSASDDEICSVWENCIIEKKIDFSDVWFGADERDRRKIREMRHSLPVKVNELMQQRGFRKIGTDIAMPENEFEEFYKMAIGKTSEAKLDYVAFGHFGDSHLHLNLLPKNSDELERAKALYILLCHEAIIGRGSFSAEHGVGKLKKYYLLEMMGPQNVQFMIYVKSKFDPNNLLGIGNLFDN